MRNTSKTIGMFTITMISIAGVFNVASLPSMSEYGFTLVSYYIAAAILFLIPTALICAELSTALPKAGGLYAWVQQAFGQRLGFLVIWLEAANTIIAFPTRLSLGALLLAYAVHPPIIHHKVMLFALMLAFLWGATLFNLLGIRLSLWVSSISVILGTIFPGCLIIILGIYWLVSGHPAQIVLNASHLMPDLHWNNAAFLAGLVLSYSGMQIAAYHAQDVDNPKRNFPKAILIATVFILLLSILGALSIAIVVPQKQINLAAGLIQLVSVFFTTFHLNWLVTPIAILMLLGFFASFNIWLLSPCRGLLACVRYQHLPKFLSRTTQHNVPRNLLLLQALITTLLSSLFLFMPTISSSYWLLTVLSAQLTFIMYIALCAAAIKLRYQGIGSINTYRVPGGNIGLCLIAGIVIIVCIAAFFVGFFPPTRLINIGSKLFYDAFLIVGMVVIMMPVLLIRPKK
ncbi:MAG: APC family permease [Pseudomonadota bacterium]